MSDDIILRLERIEAAVNKLLTQEPPKEWYTTDEAADLLGKRPYTVREWCRHRRVHAKKRAAGRGHASEWVISHDELQRIRNEGLLAEE